MCTFLGDKEINDSGFLLSFADTLTVEAGNKLRTMTGKDWANAHAKQSEESWGRRRPDKQSWSVSGTRGIF